MTAVSETIIACQQLVSNGGRRLKVALGAMNRRVNTTLDQRHTVTLQAVTALAMFAVSVLEMFILMPLFVNPALAQNATQTLNDTVCGTGVGSLVALGLTALSVYLGVKALVRGSKAMDKLGSAKEQEQMEGRQLMKGTLLTAAGALVPVAGVPVLELAGIPTISCIIPNF